MARADKAPLVGHPGHCAAEMGALAVECEKAAILQTREIETSLGEGGHRPGLETLDRTGDKDGGVVVTVSVTTARSEKLGRHPHRLDKRYPTEQQPHPPQKAPPCGFEVFLHNHTPIIGLESGPERRRNKRNGAKAQTRKVRFKPGHESELKRKLCAFVSLRLCFKKHE